MLFAEDVEQRRLVVVSLVPLSGDRFEGTILAWIEAPRGAEPATIARAVATSYGTSGAQPFMILNLDLQAPKGTDAHIGLAPPGCSIATAARPALADWRPEPTDSYVVRTAATAHSEWWRVTCDGVVRWLTPAPFPDDPNGPGSAAISDDDVRRALADAPNPTDHQRAKAAMQTVAYNGGYALSAKPDIAWSGRVTGFGSSAGAIVAAAPLSDGRWIGVVHITPDRPDPGRGLPGACSRPRLAHWIPRSCSPSP